MTGYAAGWKSNPRGGDPLDYFTILPAAVRHDHSLSPLAKLVYGDISALARITGLCTATNATLGAENGRGKTAIGEAITALEERGHIRVTYSGAGNTLRTIIPLSENRKGIPENREGIDTDPTGKPEAPLPENRQDPTGKPEGIIKKLNNNYTYSHPKGRERSAKVFDSDSLPYKAALFLDRRIRENYPKIQQQTEAGLQKWADEFDKCHRIDGWEWKDISDILAYSQDSMFWRKNIRSGGKFRKQCDALYAEAVEKGEIARG